MVLGVVDMTFWKTCNVWSVAKNENSKECYWNVIHSLEGKKTVMKSHVSHCGRFLKQVSIWKQTRQPHNFGSWADHDQRYIFRSTSKTEKQPLRRFYLLFDWSWTFLITTTTQKVTSWIYVVTTLAKAWCEALWLLQT